MSEQEIEKIYESPEVFMYPDDDHENYHIEITMVGVEKDTIKLKMHEDSFFVSGKADNTNYIGSYAVCCPIEPEKAKAAYKNGILKVDVPFKEPEFKNVEVKIE